MAIFDLSTADEVRLDWNSAPEGIYEVQVIEVIPNQKGNMQIKSTVVSGAYKGMRLTATVGTESKPTNIAKWGQVLKGFGWDTKKLQNFDTDKAPAYFFDPKTKLGRTGLCYYNPTRRLAGAQFDVIEYATKAGCEQLMAAHKVKPVAAAPKPNVPPATDGISVDPASIPGPVNGATARAAPTPAPTPVAAVSNPDVDF